MKNNEKAVLAPRLIESLWILGASRAGIIPGSLWNATPSLNSMYGV